MFSAEGKAEKSPVCNKTDGTERLEFNPENVISNIQNYANTSAASIPIALVEAIESGKMKLPCSAILTGFGAGMTVGTTVVRLREGIA